MKNSNISIGLSNPKSPDNVAAVMRAASNFRVESVFYTGQRYPRAIRLNPGAPNISRKASNNIPLSGVECLIDNTPKNMKIVCVELVENAVALPEYLHPDHACYIFGPEDGTLSQDIIDKADAVVYVPTIGCMNLAATVNIVLYDRLTKTSQYFEHNKLIRQNRDRNNNVRVKLKK